MSSETLKTERLEARVRPSDKAFIEDAASHLGISVADFLVSSAKERAEEVIRRRDQIELSRRDQQAFVESLLHPAEATIKSRGVVEIRASVAGVKLRGSETG